MKKSIKTKVLSLVASFAMVFSLLGIPAKVHATELQSGETPPKIYESGDNLLELVGKISADGDWGAIQVKNNATLTIKGNGESHAINKTGYGTNVWASGSSKIIIEDGYYTNEPDTVSSDSTHVDLIYATDNSSIEIYGGKFVNATPKWTLNAKDHKEGQTATITVYGGTYYQFDPANANVGKGEVFLAEGYISVQEGDWYTVYKENPDSIELDKTNETLLLGTKIQLNGVLKPTNIGIYNDDIQWSSSDTQIATVDENGLVTAKGVGKTTITAKVGDKTDTCVVNVYKIEEPVLPNDQSNVTVDKGASEVLGNTTSSIVEDVKSGTVPNNVELKNEEVKEKLTNATNITTEVVAEPVKEETVEKETIKAIDKVLIESDKANNNKSEVVQYLDLSVLLKADGDEVGKITQLDKGITFNVEVPKEVQKDGLNFYVVRFHDGKAERLNSTYENGIVSFVTNKFSTYALVSEVETVNMTLAAMINGKVIAGEDLVELMKLGGATNITVDDLTEKVEKGYALTKEEVAELEKVMKQFKDEELVFKGFFVDKDGKVKLDETYVFDKDTTVYMIFETKDGDMSVVPTPGDKEEKPVDTNKPSTKPTEKEEIVKTDDENNMTLYALFAGLALVSGTILVLTKKREEFMK